MSVVYMNMNDPTASPFTPPTTTTTTTTGVVPLLARQLLPLTKSRNKALPWRCRKTGDGTGPNSHTPALQATNQAVQHTDTRHQRVKATTKKKIKKGKNKTAKVQQRQRQQQFHVWRLTRKNPPRPQSHSRMGRCAGARCARLLICLNFALVESKPRNKTTQHKDCGGRPMRARYTSHTRCAPAVTCLVAFFERSRVPVALN